MKVNERVLLPISGPQEKHVFGSNSQRIYSKQLQKSWLLILENADCCHRIPDTRKARVKRRGLIGTKYETYLAGPQRRVNG